MALFHKCKGDTMDVTDNTFEKEVIEKSKETPVIVDFWAAWCGPCRVFSPIINKIAKKYEGKVILAKVNVDDNPTHALKYKIMGVPTLILFKNGVAIAQSVGAIPEEEVEKWINDNI